MSNAIATADAFIGIFGMKRVENPQICQSCKQSTEPVSVTYPLLACKLTGQLRNGYDTCARWEAKQ